MNTYFRLEGYPLMIGVIGKPINSMVQKVPVKQAVAKFSTAAAIKNQSDVMKIFLIKII